MDSFKVLAWDRLVNMAFIALVTRFPVLSLGPLAFIAQWLLTKFADELYAQMKLEIELNDIEFNNRQYHSEYKIAAVKLRLIAIKHGAQSDEFKKAKTELSNSLDKFISF